MWGKIHEEKRHEAVYTSITNLNPRNKHHRTIHQDLLRLSPKHAADHQPQTYRYGLLLCMERLHSAIERTTSLVLACHYPLEQEESPSNLF